MVRCQAVEQWVPGATSSTKARQMVLDHGRRSATTKQVCVVCAEPVDGANPLCSRACLLDARRELDQNLSSLRVPTTDDEDRSSLLARNGELTSALIGWSP